MHLLLVEAILEDIFSDIVKKNPGLEDQLTFAKNKGVKPKYFAWLAKVLGNTQEPIQDIVPVLKAFDTKQPQLKAKFGGKATDIYQYKSVQDLSNQLEKLNQSSTTSHSNGDVLYEDDTWLLVFPKNTEESCNSGKGTAWCTARTQSQNLFASYAGRNVFLFYVINKQENPRANPNAKLSIGWIDGKPVFDGQQGGTTVNANNDGISEDQFRNLIGTENASRFLELMKNKVQEFNSSHPVKKEFEFYASNLDTFIKKFNTFQDPYAKEDFVEIVLSQENVSKEVFHYLANDFDFKELVALSEKTPPDILDKLAGDTSKLVVTAVAINPNSSYDTLKKIYYYQEPRFNDALAKNPKAGNILISLYNNGDTYGTIRRIIAENPGTPKELLKRIAMGTNTTETFIVAKNPSTPAEGLKYLARKEAPRWNKAAVAENPNCPIDLWKQLLNDSDEEVRQAAQQNPTYKNQLQEKLSFYHLN